MVLNIWKCEGSQGFVKNIAGPDNPAGYPVSGKKKPDCPAYPVKHAEFSGSIYYSKVCITEKVITNNVRYNDIPFLANDGWHFLFIDLKF